MNDLIKYEIEEVEDLAEFGALEKGFCINDLEGANWAFRKIAALKTQAKENEDLAEKEHLRINTWLESQNDNINGSIEYFEGLLKAYILKLKRDNPKARLNTPYGKIIVRKNNRWVYNDDAVLAYLKQNDPALIKAEVKENVNKSELKKKYPAGVNTETGEVIAGVTIVEEENITIKLNEM